MGPIELLRYLEVSEFGEGVDDDTEDDVQADGGDEDEEGEMIDDEEAEPHERVFRGVTRQGL